MREVQENLPNHIAGREHVIQTLREELQGPSPQGDPIDCSTQIVFDEPKASYGPWKQQGSGEEILQRDGPLKRYGIGVLYPLEVLDEATNEETTAGVEGGERELLTKDAQTQISEIADRAGEIAIDSNSGDPDLANANQYRPSTIGISFLPHLRDEDTLRVSVTGGRYDPKIIRVAGTERSWWLRRPIQIITTFSAQMLNQRTGLIPAATTESTNTEGLTLATEVFVRPSGQGRLVTVCAVNRTPQAGPIDTCCVFQIQLSVTVKNASGTAGILPYPTPQKQQPDEEEESLALLYRDVQTYAVGHGCAADWDTPVSGKTHRASAESLPACEVPSITPEVLSRDGTPLRIRMALLAGLTKDEDPFDALNELANEYEAWIKGRTKEAACLPGTHQAAAQRHLAECARCLERMCDGIAYLQRDTTAFAAFQLANHAILLQQVRQYREPRRLNFDARTHRLTFDQAYPEPDLLNTGTRGSWYAFQAAFLLASVISTADGSARDRETVELIWFPTGGGKTEAYLGLAAFSMFLRRLRNPTDTGVNVLTRYTLRLLTAQQFQRAAGLICAMEYLRRRGTNQQGLGDTPFTIGIWLGSATTPNKRQDARTILARLVRGVRETENPFLLDRCPWCGAQMGSIKYRRRPPRGVPRVFGYERSKNSVILRCTDQQCPFQRQLPVYVIDEDIYAHRPTIVIGTIDKFAMLAWRPEARSLFGIDSHGNRTCSPPGLIIQDELHLIAGPLGSLAGLYETIIEELCTDHRATLPIRPKLVSSTATIRRYEDQIRHLYARTDTALFPPPGLTASDSFFARYARDTNGALLPGRVYLGVHGRGLGSLQTAQVRTMTALLQAPMSLPEDARDPWWTLLTFFNSLRELGTTLSLFQSDIRDRFKVMRHRLGIPWQELRRLMNVKELTGRLHSDEVPQAIQALEVPYGSTERPVDVCLASNIIEVGIDITRLSLLCVVGQPKTTAQYIQVTGRVGRRWNERPGLVVTIYSPSKPRDRSHFEQFRSYHERLYSHVEPTSVTPFSAPALDRALHAILTIYARQLGDAELAQSPYPYPSDLVDRASNLLRARADLVDPNERKTCEQILKSRIAEWQRWERTRWSDIRATQDAPLLREAGGYVPREWVHLSWPTPTSMRTVDAECDAIITSLYLSDEE